ncbi:MAG: NAD-dependent epimerase/dehydratase family protein [Gemmatimonadota bacterium]
MKVLVTGADGFVGRFVVDALLTRGDEVMGTLLPGRTAPTERERLTWRPVDLTDGASVEALFPQPVDAVIHLAAVASGLEARRDPGHAWVVNAAGTARLAAALGRLKERAWGDPLLLVVSTGEVYGRGVGRPSVETDPVEPVSPYAASKLGAETAALAEARRSGLRVIVARSFPHTGPGHTGPYALPSFAERIRAAAASGARMVPTGNLDPVRDYLDVRDVAAAYLALVDRAEPGIYNVASGEGHSLRALFERLAQIAGHPVTPSPEPGLMRRGDLFYLVGDSTRLRRATGWAPAISLQQTLTDLMHAQAH